MVQVGNMQADIGARENRLQVTQTMLEGMELSDKERKGRIEDVDFAELMSQLSQQQTIYQAILKSSSMIMKMSLVDYV
jgi:flagellar hook-associated protein 3 FlgL